jgi:hypothetical protein
MHDKFVYFTKILFKSPQAKGFRTLADFPRPLAVVLTAILKPLGRYIYMAFIKPSKISAYLQ